MLSANRILELTLFDFKNSLTSLRGLAYLISYLFFWYLVFENISYKAVEWLESGQGLMFATWLLQDQDLALQLFVDRSVNLSIYLLISLSITPIFIMLAAHNQFSSDATRGSFRFILTRTTRTELFLSRFISVLLLVTSCTVLTVCWATILAWLNDEDTLQAILLFGLETLIIVLFYSLPFIAYMSIISSLCRSAFGALCLGVFTYVILILLILWLRNDISFITYIIPSGIKPLLYKVSIDQALVSIISLSLYTTIYSLIAWTIFQRRDL